jgi:hypothetical protein
MSEFKVKALADLEPILGQLGKALCIALELFGEIEIRYKVSDTCTIVLTVKKE